MARTPAGPASLRRSASAWYSRPVDSNCPGPTERIFPVKVGGLSNATPAGTHSRTLVAPTATGKKPTGTPSLSTRMSPRGGMKLPPPPVAPSWGSSATRQACPSQATTLSVAGFNRASAWLAAFDCPATTNSSPTPTCFTAPSATRAAPFLSLISRPYHPPAGASMVAANPGTRSSNGTGLHSPLALPPVSRTSRISPLPSSRPRTAIRPRSRPSLWKTCISMGLSKMTRPWFIDSRRQRTNMVAPENHGFAGS